MAERVDLGFEPVDALVALAGGLARRTGFLAQFMRQAGEFAIAFGQGRLGCSEALFKCALALGAGAAGLFKGIVFVATQTVAFFANSVELLDALVQFLTRLLYFLVGFLDLIPVPGLFFLELGQFLVAQRQRVVHAL